MAFIHKNNTVRTTVTQIAEVPVGQRQNITVYIQNNDAATIYVGDSSVTTTGANAGWKIVAGASTQFWCNSGDEIYAISAAGTTANSVIVTYSA
jgi:hypothetical protein